MTPADHEKFELVVNGVPAAIECSAGETLLDVLRSRLGLTGAKLGCGIGYCGSCTVLVDGDAAHGVCLLAATLDGREITTVEGVGVAGGLDEVQQAFLDAGAIQCGYCIPGFVMSVRGLLDVHPDVDEDEARQFLTGNICRCSGYASIVRAALDVEPAEQTP